MENPRFSEMKRGFLGTFGIIESAMKIPFRNPNFIILTLITSFPLFSLTLLQKLPVDYHPTLIYEAIDLLRSFSDHAMTLNLTITIMEIYLFNLVNFLLVLTTIHAASSIYTSNVRSVTGLRNLLRNSVTKKRWHGCMFTLFNISLLCSFSLSAIQHWHYARPLVPSCCPPRHFRLVQSGCPTRHSRLSGLAMHWIVYGVAIVKWLEYSVRWNLIVVVSVLEEKRGLFEAITASSELSKGKMLRGWLFFMLLFSVGRLDLPSFLARWTYPYRRSIIACYFLETSLWCLGKVVTWVLLTVYYYDCIKIVLLNSKDRPTEFLRSSNNISTSSVENLTLLN